MRTESSPIIQLNDVSVQQEQHLILSGVELTLLESEFAYLIGPTGSGKSSLLRLLYADVPLASGEGIVTEFALHALRPHEIPFLRRKLGIIFQEFELLTDRTVADNLRFVLKATDWRDKTAIERRIEEVLTQVKLEGKAKNYPWQLSGGEQQRVAIARALLNRPKLILADEPTGNLDPGVANEILQLFIHIHEQEATAILMATHHHNFIKKYPARVLKCEHKQIRSISAEKVRQSIERHL